MNNTINTRQLDNIQRMSLELLACTDFLGNEESDLTEKIYNSLRKIIICNHFSNRQIIAVTGMQGVGKTTLMKNFYGLSDEFFNITLNRSEKLPVLITEREDCVVPQMQVSRVIQTQDGYDVQIVTVDSQTEFIEASKGDDSQVMYLELIVPYKHTHNSHTSFMLLPGFENRGDYWEELISFSAKCSDTALFLIDNMRLAREENRKKLNEMRDRFGEQMIYVITKSDRATDNNEQAKAQLAELTGAGKERIVCAGAYFSDEENNAWIAELKKAIDMFSNDPNSTRNYYTQYICDEIQHNTRPIILKLKRLLQADNGTMIVTQLQNSSWLNAFDKHVAKMRKQYKAELENALASPKQDSLEHIKRHFEEQSGWTSLRRAVLGTSAKDIIKTQQLIKEAVFANGQLLATPNLFAATSQLAGYIEAENNTKALLVEEPFDSQEETALVLTAEAPEIMHDVKALLQKNKGPEVLVGNNAKQAVETIVEMGTCYFCSANTISATVVDNVSMAETQLTCEAVSQGASAAKKFSLSMLGIVGVDALDGDADFVKYVSEALAISSTAATIGLAAISAIGAGVTVVRDINRLGREDLVTCNNAVQSIYDSIVDDCLGKYDDYMERIRDTVENNLISNTQEQRAALDKYNALCLINRIEEEVRNYLNKMRGNSYGLGSTFDRSNTMAN